MVVKPWVEAELRSARGKRAVMLYAQMIANKCLDFDMLSLVYRPETGIPVATLKRFIREDGFMTAVNTEIMDILEDKGVTKEWLVKMRKEIAKKALKNERFKEALDALDKFESMHEMTPRAVSVTHTDQITLQHKEAGMLDSVTVKTTDQIEAHKETPDSTPEASQDGSQGKDIESKPKTKQ